MDETKPATVDTATAAAKVIADNFWDLLDTLVPDSPTQTITDVTGKVWTVPTLLCAERQIKVMRAMKKLLAISTNQTAPNVTAVTNAVKTGEIVSALVASIDAIDDPQVFQVLNEGMHGAFGPGDDNAGALAPLLENTIATRVFTLEDIVGALLPFAVRLVRKLGRAMTPITNQLPTNPT